MENYPAANIGNVRNFGKAVRPRNANSGYRRSLKLCLSLELHEAPGTGVMIAVVSFDGGSVGSPYRAVCRWVSRSMNAP
jgi:hypothetical protein